MGIAICLTSLSSSTTTNYSCVLRILAIKTRMCGQLLATCSHSPLCCAGGRPCLPSTPGLPASPLSCPCLAPASPLPCLSLGSLTPSAIVPDCPARLPWCYGPNSRASHIWCDYYVASWNAIVSIISFLIFFFSSCCIIYCLR